MKILLLSCGTGGGHDSAAKALLERFQELNIECKIIDPIKLKNEKVSNNLNKSHIKLVTNTPNVFKKMYRLAELYGNLKIKSPIYGINKIFAKTLEDYIIDNNFDVVITTHLYPAEILSSIRKRNSNIHFIVVATDYVSIPFWEETNPDYFIIPNKSLKESFTSKGISENKLVPLGIPISMKFQNNITQKEARIQLSLPLNKKIVLMMSGSTGFGNPIEVIDKMLELYNNKIYIIFVCGTNKKLSSKLTTKYKDKILVKEYVEGINIYMKACDLIMTKPGGLSSTESAISNVPIIFINPIPGCETYNAEFFEDKGMALNLTNIIDLKSYMEELLYNKKQIKIMKQNQLKNINKKSTIDICNFIIKKYNNK
ncbi:MAG TPA: glycosyltransferase [Bacilli bacterium]|nr:glycosyltransferase [Bacilli bacterium]